MVPTSDSVAPRNQRVSDEFAQGTKVGGYTLVARLASGGMAHVWTAEPDRGSGLGRLVAVKIIRDEFAGNQAYAKMFIDEAMIATAIDHPNVCQTFELDRHGSMLFMAMEWVPGDSLGGMLRQDGAFRPLDPGVAVRICADACAGLHAAHEVLGEDGHPLGVIHRDVSPPNILISLQGQVKVSDFGVAKARHQLHERTKTGEVKGKFAYLAPEQISGKGSDRRIDVYAMGCVLYVATMGVRPFGNGARAMARILVNQYKRPSAIDPMYPPGLEAIIVRALAHKPEDRFQTTEEMRDALEQWLVDSRLVVTHSDVAKALQERMHPDALKAVRGLQGRRLGRKVITQNFLLDVADEAEPPTAAGAISYPELFREDATATTGEAEDSTAIASFDPAPLTEEGSDDQDRSGWHATGAHEVPGAGRRRLAQELAREEDTTDERSALSHLARSREAETDPPGAAAPDQAAAQTAAHDQAITPGSAQEASTRSDAERPADVPPAAERTTEQGVPFVLYVAALLGLAVVVLTWWLAD